MLTSRALPLEDGVGGGGIGRRWRRAVEADRFFLLNAVPNHVPNKRRNRAMPDAGTNFMLQASINSCATYNAHRVGFV